MIPEYHCLISNSSRWNIDTTLIDCKHLNFAIKIQFYQYLINFAIFCSNLCLRLDNIVIENSVKNLQLFFRNNFHCSVLSCIW